MSKPAFTRRNYLKIYVWYVFHQSVCYLGVKSSPLTTDQQEHSDVTWLLSLYFLHQLYYSLYKHLYVTFALSLNLYLFSILTREFGRQFCSRVFKQHERRNKFRIHVNEQCCNSQEQSLSPSFALSLGKTKMQQHNSEKNKRPGKQCEQIFIFHTWTVSLWKHWKNTGPALKHYVML